MNMKKIIVFMLLFSSLAIVYAQDFFMYVGGEKRYFEISPNKMLVQFVENTEISAVKNIMGQNRSFQVSDISKTDYREWHLVGFLDMDKTKIMELLQNRNNNGILFSGVVFVDKDGEKIAALTNQIIVRLKQEEDYTILQKSIEAYKIDYVRQDEFENKTYLLHMNYSSEKDAMQIANELYETGFFEYAEPNLMLFIKYGTNDTYFSDQWGLNNTGQYGGIAGMDIKATQAWRITTGNPNVRIAILDSGTDLTHPDLISNLLPGFDATGGSNNGNDLLGHGTACAGIAAARGNNSRGIAGVAYNCRILPISMGSSPLASRVAAGLNWARLNGANVVSMSFFTTETNDVNTAISTAYSSGRVLVAATGNSNTSTVSYPARHSNVIAVGAASPCGERKSPSSCDGENWGSQYGNELSVVAPGVFISTTDIQGNGGYNYSGKSNDYSDRDYIQWFNGTSAATPFVAGVAALVLSINPNLTALQVRNIIESTAQKVGNYTYSTTSGRPNGTWNNQMGYGLVNAYAAVQAACPTTSFTTPTISTTQTVTGGNINVRNVTVTSGATLTIKAVCDINVQGVTVKNNSKLILDAGGEVNIISDFDVQLGSEFEIVYP